MGGLPPLGYDVQDRKLVVNDAEAATVRHIFRRHAELGSVRLLQRELNTGGLVSKKRHGAAGRRWGNKPFARGALYLMLQNRIYRGEIVHKEKCYPGEHAAIVATELWNSVQRRLSENRVERRVRAGAAEPSLLAGLLHDEIGERMTPSHAVKAGRRYRYYVSRPLIAGGRSAAPVGRRIPAGDIEQLVGDRLRGFLACEPDLHQAIEPDNADAAGQRALIERAADLARSWETLVAAERIKVLQTLCARIDLHEDRLDLHLTPARLPLLLSSDHLAPAQQAGADDPQRRLTLSIRARVRRAGLGVKMIVQGARAGAQDSSLIRLLVKAHEFRASLLASDCASVKAFAGGAGISGSFATRLLRLAFLAPDIVKDVLDGRQRPTLNAAKLLMDSRLPLGWTEQRTLLGFA